MTSGQKNILLVIVAAGSMAAVSTHAATQLGINYDTAYTGFVSVTGGAGALGSPGGEDVYLTAFQATYQSGDSLPFPTTNPFYTFCVDIMPTLVSPGSWQASNFPLGNNGNSLQYVPGGIQTAANLYNTYVSLVDISTPQGQLNGAALQVAIWSALYGPAFSVTGEDPNVAAITAQMLGGPANFPNPALTSTFWNAVDPLENQDLIGPQMNTAFAPEPASYAAAVSSCALMSLWGVSKNRRKK
jgi:hypothetical protein